MQAKEVMSEGVMSMPSDTTILQAAEMLLNTRVSAMPVLDGDGMMVGIISLSDLIRGSALGSLNELADDARALTAHHLAGTRPVTEVMSKDVIVVTEGASLLDIAKLMETHKVKRVPVVEDGAVVGIVSQVDLLKALISFATSESPRRPSMPATDPADDRLREAIVAAIGTVPGLSIGRADVVVKGAVAHLWGVVPNDMTRRSCDALVQKVPGVKSVLNHMHISATAARSQR
jgi:CBS-domain-containing membrane protein